MCYDEYAAPKGVWHLPHLPALREIDFEPDPPSRWDAYASQAQLLACTLHSEALPPYWSALTQLYIGIDALLPLPSLPHLVTLNVRFESGLEEDEVVQWACNALRACPRVDLLDLDMSDVQKSGTFVTPALGAFFAEPDGGSQRWMDDGIQDEVEPMFMLLQFAENRGVEELVLKPLPPRELVAKWQEKLKSWLLIRSDNVLPDSESSDSDE